MNCVVHIYNEKTGIHAQPFTVCEACLSEVKLQISPDLDSKVEVIGETKGYCGVCEEKKRALIPLRMLEFLSQNSEFSDDDLSILAFRLGYRSLEYAWDHLERLAHGPARLN